jgi:hypothetical protein
LKNSQLIPRLRDEKLEFAAASNQLRPQIVPADYLHQTGDLVHRGFSAGLVLAYAIDEKERYELIRQPDIDSWNVGQTEIEARAIANLEAVSAGISLSPRSNPDAISPDHANTRQLGVL